MDDYQIDSLYDSRNEWSSRLVSILTNPIIDGFTSIFNESLNVCEQNNEEEKYLMTFQNFISRISQWNTTIISNEVHRIEQCTKCNYISDLITCVHITHLKALTCIKVGDTSKKIDIDIPDLDKFIHSVYINVARKLYTNIYLFEIDILPLEKQKRKREFEVFVKQSILDTIRDNIPIDKILRKYLDENEDVNVQVDEVKEVIKIKDTNEDLKLKVENLENEAKKENENTEKEEEVKSEDIKIISDESIKISKVDNEENNDNDDSEIKIINEDLDVANNEEKTSNILITNEENNLGNTSEKEEDKLSLKFNDFNNVNNNGIIEDIPAEFPEASTSSFNSEDDENYDSDDEKITIGDSLDLNNNLITEDLSEPMPSDIEEDPILNDVEVLI
jgi:hypothetical protein